MVSQTQTAVRTVHAGLIGSGIQRSRTPAMHVEEARCNGIECRYDLIDLDVLGVGADALPGLIRQAQDDGFAGLNITHPCKQAATHEVDELSEHAEALGAINTIVFRDGRRIGHNTDWWGFASGFRRGLPGAHVGNVVLIGAGGAGVAVAHALATLGAQTIRVFDIDPQRTARLVAQLAPHHAACRFEAGEDMAQALRQADGLAHATPTGMVGHPGLPIDPDLLEQRHWVAEVVYFPLETALLQAAAQRGCRVVNGGGMAVYQAVGAFELFTGIAPDVERMIRHFGSLGEGGGI